MPVSGSLIPNAGGPPNFCRSRLKESLARSLPNFFKVGVPVGAPTFFY